jgi:hypothetical protein
MNRSRFIAGTLALFVSAGLLAGGAFAAEAVPNISGTWTTSFDSMVGEQKYTYNFKVEGGKLTGTAKSNLGEATISDGKVDKDVVTFIEHLTYEGMVLDITYQGKIVSADEIKFKRDVGGQGGEEFTAKREKK